MKRAVLYMRVSTLDQHPETQLHDLSGTEITGWRSDGRCVMLQDSC